MIEFKCLSLSAESKQKIWDEWNTTDSDFNKSLLGEGANLVPAKKNAAKWGGIIAVPYQGCISTTGKFIAGFVDQDFEVSYWGSDKIIRETIHKPVAAAAPCDDSDDDDLPAHPPIAAAQKRMDGGANASGDGASAMEVDAAPAPADAGANANGAGADAMVDDVAASNDAPADANGAGADAMVDDVAASNDAPTDAGAVPDLLAVNATLDKQDGDFRDAIASGFEAMPEPGLPAAAGCETDAVPAAAGGETVPAAEGGASAVVEEPAGGETERPAKRSRVAPAPETVQKVGAASTAPSPLSSHSHSHSHSHDGGGGVVMSLCTSDSDSSSDDDGDELRRLRAARDALDEKIKLAVGKRGKRKPSSKRGVKKDRGRRNADRTSWLVKAPPNFSTNDLTEESMRVIPHCSILFFATDLPKVWINDEYERGEQHKLYTGDQKIYLQTGKAKMGVEYMTGQAILRYIKDQELRGSTGGKIFVGSQPQGRGDGRRVPTLAEVSEDSTINYRSSAIRLCVLYGRDETSTFECLADRPKDALAIEDPFLCVQPYKEMHKQLFDCHLAGAKSRVGAIEHFLTNSKPKEDTATFLTHSKFMLVSFYEPTPVVEASAVLAGWGLTMFATEEEEESSSSGEEISDSSEEDESAVDFD